VKVTRGQPIEMLRVKLDAAIRDAQLANIRGDTEAEFRHFAQARDIELDIYAAEWRAERLAEYAAARAAL